MKYVPSSAIEKGLTAQLMNSVTPTPRMCSVTLPSAPKSIFSSIGMIISQISRATGRLTLAISRPATAAKAPGIACPKATPATLQSPTQSVRYFSKTFMSVRARAGLASAHCRLLILGIRGRHRGAARLQALDERTAQVGAAAAAILDHEQ